MDRSKNKSSITRASRIAAPDWQQPVFATSTFARLPYLPNPAKGEADIAILGVPWDGLVTYQPGARFGPREIRQASITSRSFSQHMNVSVFEEARVVDTGDVKISNFDYQKTFQNIEARAYALQSNNISVVSLGGDHSILLPLMRAAHKSYGEFTLVQFDAHTDTSVAEDTLHHHGTCIRNAIDEGLVKGSQVFQIGIRGSFGSADYLDYGDSAGINVLDMHGFHDQQRRSDFIERIHEVANGKPCYLTFDIDGVDPAFAPGTGTPVPGGLSSFEAIDTLRALRGLNFIGGDVVEVAPVYDNRANITSLLAASITLQICALVAIGNRTAIQQIK